MTSEEFKRSLEQVFASAPMPAAVDFVASGQRRLASHRRRIVLGVGTVAIMLAVALPVSAKVLGTDGRHVDAATTSDPEPGWQVVSWSSGGIEFDVPESWRPGDPSQWCRMSATNQVPTFRTPDMGGSTDVRCANPTSWFGASIVPVGEVPENKVVSGPAQYTPPPGDEAFYPTGSWVAQVELTPEWSLLIVAQSEDAATTIADSVRHAS